MAKTNVEEGFHCTKCGEFTKPSDYEWEDRNLYKGLKKMGLCEGCARGLK